MYYYLIDQKIVFIFLKGSVRGGHQNKSSTKNLVQYSGLYFFIL